MDDIRGLVAAITTMKCPVRCRHCICNCGPDRTSVLDWKATERFLAAVAEAELANRLVLTGGEPLLFADHIERLTRRGADLGIKSALVTCCDWAISVDKARSTLLRVHGLTRLVASTDRFHQEHIPPERVRNAVIAALSLGIPDIRVLGVVLTREDRNWPDLQRQFGDLAGPTVSLHAQPFIAAGRGRQLVNACDDLDSGPPEGTCPIEMPTISPSGVVVACCGPFLNAKRTPLVIGNIHTDSPADVWQRYEQDPLLRALRILTPMKLAEAVAQAGGPDVMAGRRYVLGSACSVCLDLLGNKEARRLAVELANSEHVQRRVNVLELMRGYITRKPLARWEVRR